jgi:hypothetical protein
MMKCPNCGSEKHRLQLALDFTIGEFSVGEFGIIEVPGNQRVCAGCGCTWPEFVPTAIAMIIESARTFPKLKFHDVTRVAKRTRPRLARRIRGLNSRQMMLRAAL